MFNAKLQSRLNQKGAKETVGETVNCRSSKCRCIILYNATPQKQTADDGGDDRPKETPSANNSSWGSLYGTRCIHTFVESLPCWMAFGY